MIEAVYAALTAVDLSRLFELVDEDCVITQDVRLPWGGRHTGHDGLATFGLRLRESIVSTVTSEGMFVIDGDVIQFGRTVGTTVETGRAFDIAELHRWTVRNGRVATAHFSIDTLAMLAALGDGASTGHTTDCGTCRRQLRPRMHAPRSPGWRTPPTTDAPYRHVPGPLPASPIGDPLAGRACELPPSRLDGIELSRKGLPHRDTTSPQCRSLSRRPTARQSRPTWRDPVVAVIGRMCLSATRRSWTLKSCYCPLVIGSSLRSS